MLGKQRKYGLGIWALGLGFYLFYTPYSGLTKALSNGLLPGMHGRIPGTVLLPVSAVATVIGMFGFITLMGWWKYAGHREFFGLSMPFPRRLTFLSGICMATIMGTTTLAFTFGGLSIVLVLILLRGGTLIIAPLVDAIVRRRVRWFSWAAMFVSLLAVLVALSDAADYKIGIAAAVDITAYLVAYFFKLQFMSRLAKSDDRSATLRYFVEEQMVASPILVLTLIVMALVGAGDVMMGFRVGLTSFLGSTDAIFAALVGLFYAALCVCTTLIFLDRRENTFCVPMHCGSSMLSGFTASYALAFFFNQSSPGAAQLASAGLIVIALGFLSPLHHFQRTVRWVGLTLGGSFGKLRNLAFDPKRAPIYSPVVQSIQPGPTGRARLDDAHRIFLFVCSGNTCRSPMAAALSNAEIARRLNIPVGAVETVNIQALSAGISAHEGAPMTPEAEAVLRSLNVRVAPHAARSLTVELAQQAERIFCMTSAHRQAVMEMIPSVAWKTYCLDHEGDIEDPIGKGPDVYLKCARRIRDLLRMRLDELGLQGEVPA